MKVRNLTQNKIWIITFVAYGTYAFNVYADYYRTKEEAERCASELRACGHKLVRVQPLTRY